MTRLNAGPARVARLDQARVDVDVARAVPGQDHVGGQRAVPLQPPAEPLQMPADHRQVHAALVAGATARSLRHPQAGVRGDEFPGREHGLRHHQRPVRRQLGQDATVAERACGLGPGGERGKLLAPGEPPHPGGRGRDRQLHEDGEPVPAGDLLRRGQDGPFRLREPGGRERSVCGDLVLNPGQRGERRDRSTDPGAAEQGGAGGQHGHLLLGGEQHVCRRLLVDPQRGRQPAQRVGAVGGHPPDAVHLAGETGQAQGIR